MPYISFQIFFQVHQTGKVECSNSCWQLGFGNFTF